MKLQILKNLLVSYACHINSYNDFKLIKYCVSLLCRHCKLIGISYSINTNIIDDIQIIDTFLSLQKEIPNLMFCCKIENEGYDFGRLFSYYQSI